MKNWKTLVIGCMMAALLAASPLLEADGYKWDGPTITKIVLAVLIAIFSTLTKDFDVTGTPDAKDSKKN